MTDNFIILPENNYLRDPCAWLFYDDTLGDYDQTHSYEDQIDGRVLIFSIDGSFVAMESKVSLHIWWLVNVHTTTYIVYVLHYYIQYNTPTQTQNFSSLHSLTII